MQDRAPGNAPALPPRTRLDSLTGLRYFGALAVFVTHFVGSGSSGYGRIPLIYPQSTYGTHGVTFFFVLSGFVLTWMWKPGGSVGTFYWRRVARIMPLHLATSIVALWVFYEPVSRQVFEWGPYLLSLVLLQAWVPHLTPMVPGNTVSWTLSCEAFFYLCYPVLIAVLARRSRRQLLVATIAIVLAAFAWRTYAGLNLTDYMQSWSLRTPVFRIWEFTLGIILALAVRRGLVVRGGVALVAVVLAAWILVYFNVRPLLPGGVADLIVYLDQVVGPLLFAWLIGAAARNDVRGRVSWLASKPMVLLGAWSFAFYLVHYFPLRLSTMAFGPRKASDANIFDLLGMALVATALAAVFYYAIERPAERRLRNLFNRRGSGDGDGRAERVTDDRSESQVERAAEEAEHQLR
jgi:peptidoglycan/LPS O-acetylase OafA/YrhL